jgi:hypothetical protein
VASDEHSQDLRRWLKTAEENRMKKINPFLWFDSEAEQAAKFYVGIFKNIFVLVRAITYATLFIGLVLVYVPGLSLGSARGDIAALKKVASDR